MKPISEKLYLFGVDHTIFLAHQKGGKRTFKCTLKIVGPVRLAVLGFLQYLQRKGVQDDFKLGDFRASGKVLREKGINRIGNIYAPNSRYCRFEEFFQPLLEELYQEQIKTGKIFTPSEIIWKMGEKINDEKSICYWAFKNKIKIYCPAFTDGAIGDNIYFFKYKRQNFMVDVTSDIKDINDSTIGLKKSGLILLGAGVIKHHILNANMFRNGADYAVYINDAQESNGSDAGALPEEAVSWGKLLPECERIKVHGDVTILFPLLVAESFAKSL